MNNFTKGSDLVIRWSILFADGKPFPLANYAIELYYSNGNGLKTIDQSLVEVTGNTLTWTFPGREQNVPGRYSITLGLYLDGNKFATLSKRDAFTLVPGKDRKSSELNIKSYCDSFAPVADEYSGIRALTVANEAKTTAQGAVSTATTIGNEAKQIAQAAQDAVSSKAALSYVNTELAKKADKGIIFKDLGQYSGDYTAMCEVLKSHPDGAYMLVDEDDFFKHYVIKVATNGNNFGFFYSDSEELGYPYYGLYFDGTVEMFGLVSYETMVNSLAAYAKKSDVYTKRETTTLLLGKADLVTYKTDIASMNERINSVYTDMNNAIGNKADKTTVNTELAKKADKSDTYTKSQTYTRAEVNSRIEYSATMNKGKIFKDLGQKSESFAEVAADVIDGAYYYYDTNNRIYVYFIKTEYGEDQCSCLYTSTDEPNVWYIVDVDGGEAVWNSIISYDFLTMKLSEYTKTSAMNTLLNAKANDNAVVHKEGYERISGRKSFGTIESSLIELSGEGSGIQMTETDIPGERKTHIKLVGTEDCTASILVQRNPVVDMEVATKQYVDNFAQKVGDLSSLATTDKTSIVNAVNELRNNIISTLNTAV